MPQLLPLVLNVPFHVVRLRHFMWVHVDITRYPQLFLTSILRLPRLLTLSPLNFSILVYLLLPNYTSERRISTAHPSSALTNNLHF